MLSGSTKRFTLPRAASEASHIPNQAPFIGKVWRLNLGLGFGLGRSLGLWFSLAFRLGRSLGFGLALGLGLAAASGFGLALGLGLALALGLGLALALGFGLAFGLASVLGLGLGLGFGSPLASRPNRLLNAGSSCAATAGDTPNASAIRLSTGFRSVEGPLPCGLAAAPAWARRSQQNLQHAAEIHAAACLDPGVHARHSALRIPFLARTDALEQVSQGVLDRGRLADGCDSSRAGAPASKSPSAAPVEPSANGSTVRERFGAWIPPCNRNFVPEFTTLFQSCLFTRVWFKSLHQVPRLSC